MSYIYDASIIIVNYNGKRYIDILLESLENQLNSKYLFEVVFVDNGSTDGSIEYLKEKSKNYHLNLNIVDSKENLGFAGGNNLGVENSNGKFIVFLNNDTKVQSGWLDAMVEKIKSDPNIGIVNAKLLFYYDFLRLEFQTHDKIYLDKKIMINDHQYNIDPKFCNNVVIANDHIECFGHSSVFIPLYDGITDYIINLNFTKTFTDIDAIIVDFDPYTTDNTHLSLKFNKNTINDIKETLVQNAGSRINENFDGSDIGFGEVDGPKFDQEYQIDSACGASMIMLKSDFDKIGGFDETFFMYYEDSDLSYRVKRLLNKKLVYCPTALVRHIHTGSSKEWSPFFTYHVIRNKMLFVYKNISKEKYKKLLVRRILSGIKSFDFLRIRAAIDSYKIVKGSKNVRYKG